MIYTVLLIIIAVIAYGIGSMSSVVIASNYVFHVNLRRLGTGSSALSNFRRIYGAMLLFVVLGIWLTKYVSLGAVAGAAVMCIASLLLVDDPLVMKLALFAGLAVLVRHIPAVSRMLSGRETKLSFEEDISYKLDNKF